MNTFQINLLVALAGVLDLATSITVSEPKMTWADVFKDRLEVKDTKRQQRSHYSTKKAYVLSHAFESEADQGQYSLQYLDGQHYNQDTNKDSLLSTGHELKYFTVKDSSSIFSDKIKSSPFKAPLSVIYTEAEQPAEHQYVTEAYKFVTVPQKYHVPSLHHSSDVSHYYKPKDYDHDHEDGYASKYKFGYRVSDPHTGAEFGHSEVSEGHVKKGHYHVLLPDGRLQNVKYWADPSGYHATVTYEGQGYHYPSYH